MERKGTKRIKLSGLNDKRMITGIFCGNLIGELLPFPIIYGGTTKRCHPTTPFPADWDITHNKKHWSNEATMLSYIENVIIPFVEKVREEDGDLPALAIFHCFRGQLTVNITALLERYNIHSVIVPPNCTDRLQPLDLTVNKTAKSFLQREFRDWYAAEVAKQLSENETLAPVDLSTARMKCVSARWLIRLFEYLENTSYHLVNGFIAAGIPQSIDAGQPTAGSDIVNSDDDTDEDTDEENDTDDETDILSD